MVGTVVDDPANLAGVQVDVEDVAARAGEHLDRRPRAADELGQLARVGVDPPARFITQMQPREASAKNSAPS